jgi:hypothetical protein
VCHVDAADQETAIIRLRELLDEARIIAWVHVEGSDTPPRLPAVTYPEQESPRELVDDLEWPLAKARRERDEARLWAWGREHGMFPFSTADPPLWLTASTLPADPAAIEST